MESDIRYFCYPRSSEPPKVARDLAGAFRQHEAAINTEDLDDGLKSDEVLAEVRPSLEEVGFDVEQGKSQEEKIHRPVLFGENGFMLSECTDDLSGNLGWFLRTRVGEVADIAYHEVYRCRN